MACCCEEGPCCTPTGCIDTNKGYCYYSGNTFLSYGVPVLCADTGCCRPRDCYTAVSPTTPCDCQINAFWNKGACNCTTYPDTCRTRKCEACVSGQCVNTCPAPRECCDGGSCNAGSECCLESQYCSNHACVNRCSPFTTWCKTSSSPFTWTCCNAGEECCPPTGCLPVTYATVYHNVQATTPTDSGVTVTSGQPVRITASGTVQYGAGQFTTPDGIGYNIPSGDLVSYAPHMRLLVRIGTGAWLSAGSSYAFTAGATGTLQFIQNDTQVGDNSGTWTIQVKVGGCDNPGTLAADAPLIYRSMAVSGGPGTELKALLKTFGITASESCPCNAHAAEMDWREQESPGWCEQNMDRILGWLQEQANARGLPFIRLAAKLLVKRAISLAKRKSAQRGNSQ